MSNRATSDAGFDRIAGFYDGLARLVFGQTLRRAQQAALAGLPAGAPRLLIIGGGTGWILGEVFRRCPRARVLYVEASAAMLRKSRATLGQEAPAQVSQVEFRLGTEASLDPTETFDAILTFFFLDLFEPSRLDQVLRQLHAARRPGAPWLVADFRVPRTSWQRVLLKVMYLFFQLTTGIKGREMPDLPAKMATLGMKLKLHKVFFGKIIEAAVYG